jgi:hypothetical protein
MSFAWLERIKRFFCIHDDIFSREGNTIRLQCVKCLRCTEGWTIERKGSAVHARRCAS